MASLRFLLPTLVLAIPLATGLPSGCKDDTTVSADAAAGVWARAVCDLFFECACSDFNLGYNYTSDEVCRSDQETAAQRAIDEGEAAGLVYDGKCVSERIDAVQDVGCIGFDVDFETWSLNNTLQNQTACKIFSGDREAGQSCEAHPDPNFGDDCAKGLGCVTGICTTVELNPTPGESCTPQFSAPCTDHSLCLDLDGDMEAVCEQVPASGGTCLGEADLCAAGTTCDQASKRCVTAPGAEEPCAVAAWADNQCAGDAVCDGGTCRSLPGGGAACVAGRCAEGFACDAGTCVVELPLACLLPLPE